IALAEHQPTGTSRPVQAEDVATQPDCTLQPIAEEVPVEGDVRLPGVQADADLALAVVQPPGDEGAGRGDDLDLVAVGGAALDGGHGAGVDPGVPAEERPGPARLEDDAGERHVSPRSTASM